MPEVGAVATPTTDKHPSARFLELDRYAGWGLWALPLWALLLFYGTLTHQPDPQTDFAGFAKYVTTTEFLLSHLVASIGGAAVGALGFVALFTIIALRLRARLALAGTALIVAGNVVISALFGVAAFAQPALGRAYLAGQTQPAVDLYQDMYGAPLQLSALASVLLLVIGMILVGIAVARSGFFPVWIGVSLPVAMVVFGLIGVILANFVQTIGAALLIACTAGAAYTARRRPAIPVA